MLYLHGIGHFHPETIVDNKFLLDLDIGVDEDWIMQRVGIRERRTVLDLEYIRTTRNADVRASKDASRYSNAQTGCRAAQMALARANLKPSDIKMVIGGGSSQQNLVPAEACAVAAEIGIEAPCFDLNSACSTFAVQMWCLSAMAMPEGVDFALVVNPENNTRFTDYTDRRTAILFGDGATAAVVSTRIASPVAITCNAPKSSPAEWHKVRTPHCGHIHQEGQAVQAFALRTMPELFRELRRADDQAEQTFYIGHQANKTMLESVIRRLDVPETKHFFNVDRFGNCGAAGAPSVLSEHWEQFLPGSSVLMALVGAGLTWCGLRFDFGNRFSEHARQ